MYITYCSSSIFVAIGAHEHRRSRQGLGVGSLGGEPRHGARPRAEPQSIPAGGGRPAGGVNGGAHRVTEEVRHP